MMSRKETEALLGGVFCRSRPRQAHDTPAPGPHRARGDVAESAGFELQRCDLRMEGGHGMRDEQRSNPADQAHGSAPRSSFATSPPRAANGRPPRLFVREAGWVRASNPNLRRTDLWSTRCG
jgi:hypothetical protein